MRLSAISISAAIGFLLLAAPPDAWAKPKGLGKASCQCTCMSDESDPITHVPKWTSDVSFEPEYGRCDGDLGDCAVKDGGGHSHPGRLHSCTLTVPKTKQVVQPSPPIGPSVKNHP
jgi:hypothetical protein